MIFLQHQLQTLFLLSHHVIIWSLHGDSATGDEIQKTFSCYSYQYIFLSSSISPTYFQMQHFFFTSSSCVGENYPIAFCVALPNILTELLASVWTEPKRNSILARAAGATVTEKQAQEKGAPLWRSLITAGRVRGWRRNARSMDRATQSSFLSRRGSYLCKSCGIEDGRDVVDIQ